jgi:hypothetical protein
MILVVGCPCSTSLTHSVSTLSAEPILLLSIPQSLSPAMFALPSTPDSPLPQFLLSLIRREHALSRDSSTLAPAFCQSPLPAIVLASRGPALLTPADGGPLRSQSTQAALGGSVLWPHVLAGATQSVPTPVRAPCLRPRSGRGARSVFLSCGSWTSITGEPSRGLSWGLE